MLSLKEQERHLRQAARNRGLCVKRTRGLSKTPYRAMNPRAAKELGVPWSSHMIGYDNYSARTHKRLVMDLRHEIIEYDRMGRGWRYRRAHRMANRKQRTVNAV
jgi:hypothetical protein